MNRATLVMALAGFSLFNASCFAASISEQLENKLNIGLEPRRQDSLCDLG